MMYRKWMHEHGNVVAAFAISIFFALVRYIGYEADAGIYLLQVVNYLYPERFVNDVQFMFGNQDSFTIFSPLISMFFKVFGVNHGGLLATLLFEVLWCLGAYFFIVKWAKVFRFEKWAPMVFFAFVVLLVKKTYDCGFFVNLLIAEYYLVGRFLAASVALFALATFFNKNKFLSLGLFLLATAMHPLTAGWGIVLWTVYHFPKTRWLVIAGSLILPFLAFLHWGKFDFYPDDWLGKPLIYAPTYENGLVYAGFVVFWLAMALKLKNCRVARYSRCMLLMCVVGFALQFVAGHAQHVFLYQVQPFRVQWICIVSMIPVFSIYLQEHLRDGLDYRDYSVFYIAACAVAQVQFLLPLVFASFLAFIPLQKKVQESRLPLVLERMLFVVGLLFLVGVQVIGNMVSLALERNVGDITWALALIDVPEKLEPLGMLFISLFAVICFARRRYWLAFAFVLSLCNGEIKILPLVCIGLFLVPSVSSMLQKVFVAFAVVCSFAEMLDSLVCSPMRDFALGNLVFFGLLFAFLLWFLFSIGKSHIYWVPLVLLLATIGVWDIAKWDSRSPEHALVEKQMDALFEKPIFSQVKNRGGILFADRSSPIQSRINFLTGAYADATIGIGEVFFKGQYIASNHRISLLQYGRPDAKDFSNYSSKMKQLFDNRDSLLLRMELLCGLGEIEYLATDYDDLPVNKVGSAYLDQQKRSFWLYSCDEK